MNSEPRGESIPQEQEPTGPALSKSEEESGQTLSRRNFLKTAFAAGAVLALDHSPLKSGVKAVERSAENSEAFEFQGERLPDWIKRAVESHNKECKNRLLNLGAVIMVTDVEKFIKSKGITYLETQNNLRNAIAYCEIATKNIYVFNNCKTLLDAEKQAQTAAANMRDDLMRAAIDHEGEHAYKGDEVQAYSAQIAYLKKRLALATILAKSGTVTHEYPQLLGQYIAEYQKRLDRAKTDYNFNGGPYAEVKANKN